MKIKIKTVFTPSRSISISKSRWLKKEARALNYKDQQPFYSDFPDEEIRLERKKFKDQAECIKKRAQKVPMEHP